ncbi:MAG: alpha/beta hydrolase [Acidimicrobiaceae bacterium]|nr:alpha/beta hydrolase [Acidimicrobiaceae bacterium]
MYRNFDAKTLEREYSPASCVPDVQVFLDSYATRGVIAREMIKHQQIYYGGHQDEWLWYAPSGGAEHETLIVFVHGGFWRRLSADDGTFLTPGWHDLGYSVASINYSLCPNEPLDVLVDQTRRAIEFLSSRHSPARTLLVGHSAGAHLVAMAMGKAVSTEFGGAILVSGVFDLEPIIFTSVNDAVKLDPGSARRLSPIHRVADAPNTPVLIIWGEKETEEFKRQSREFATAWSTVPGHNVATTTEIASRNHFDILDELTTSRVIDLLGA